MAINYSDLAAKLKQTPTADAGGKIDYAKLAGEVRGTSAAPVDYAALDQAAQNAPAAAPVEAAPTEGGGLLDAATKVATSFVPSVETIGAGLAAPGASKMQSETDARSAALADAATRILKNPNLTPEARARVMRAMQGLSSVGGSVRDNAALQETPLQSLGKFLTTAGTLSSGALAERGAAALGAKSLAARSALGAAEAVGTFGAGGILQEGNQAIPSAIIAGGIGAAGPAAGVAGKYLAEKISPRVMNAVLKPLGKEFLFGKNPGAIVKEGIVANTRQGLLEKIVGKKKEVGALIEGSLTNPSAAAKTIDVAPLLSPIDDAIKKAVSHGDQALVDRLTAVKAGITDTFDLVGGKVESTGKKNLVLSPKDAQLLKRDIGESTKWTGQLFDSEVNKVRAQVYGNIDRAIDSAVPEVQKLNQRYANLLGAQKSMERTLSNIQRMNLASFSQLGIGGITSAGAFASGDQAPEALAKGLAVGLALKGVRSAALQTRFAQVLAHMDPAEGRLVAMVAPKIRTVLLKAVTGSGFNPDSAADEIRTALDSVSP